MITRRFAVPLFFVLCAVIFLLDANTPLGVAVWVVYILPTLFIYRTNPAHYLIPSTVVCAILTVLGFFISPPGVAIEIAIFNRSTGIIVLFVLAFLLRKRKQAEEKVARLTRVYTVLSKINQAIVRIRDETCMQCHSSFDYVDKILAEKQGTNEYSLREQPIRKIHGYKLVAQYINQAQSPKLRIAA